MYYILYIFIYYYYYYHYYYYVVVPCILSTAGLELMNLRVIWMFSLVGNSLL